MGGFVFYISVNRFGFPRRFFNDSYVTFAGFGDLNKSNNTISFSGEPYTFTKKDAFIIKLRNVFDTKQIKAGTYISSTTMVGDMSAIMGGSGGDSEKVSDLNGSWTWITDHFVRVQ